MVSLLDDFVKRPISALRAIFQNFTYASLGERFFAPTIKGCASLDLGLFTKSSDRDFLRDYPAWRLCKTSNICVMRNFSEFHVRLIGRKIFRPYI